MTPSAPYGGGYQAGWLRLAKNSYGIFRASFNFGASYSTSLKVITDRSDKFVLSFRDGKSDNIEYRQADPDRIIYVYLPDSNNKCDGGFAPLIKYCGVGVIRRVPKLG